MALSVLVIDDEQEMLTVIRASLHKHFNVVVTTSAKEGLKLVQTTDFDMILSDLRMPDMDGLEFIRQVRKLGGNYTIIVMSAYATNETALEAMKLGAYDYIAKPFTRDELLLTLRKAEEREKLQKENLKLRSMVGQDNHRMVYRSKIMKTMVSVAHRIAPYKTTVLLQGESGTGKEMMAKLLHEKSDRADKPFIAVNCGAIPETLMESELFGYQKGAFTDAHTAKKGLIEAANNGTLFLDEIGELPLQLQVKLLRFIQEGETRRIGDTKPLKVNVRIVAATSRDLQQEVKNGNFREDLFYRLNVVPIIVPPLRKREEDIPLLVEYFLKKTKERLGIQRVSGLTKEAMIAFMEYSWPGNVRELENLIERLVVLSDGEFVDIDILPEAMLYGNKTEANIDNMQGLSIKKHQRAMEESLIHKALEISHGNRTKAAKLLGISHRTLLYKMKEYEMEKEVFV